jgi:hypothetical protein
MEGYSGATSLARISSCATDDNLKVATLNFEFSYW